ncbi:Chromophore lyase CpcS/CpeS 1 [Porphyridium purpureum]|uniref:Chromophore lyase CpcS/CpeS 1 n=1 Tax=Porphyridium purpureum TaxID=35688 RepID=A0A5J4YK06_PORPP|nr:Chromophore lyase CpcS/CpeS 1 [Porphyridium purpureum]|eukprot:POR9454..scf291_13
MECAAFQSGWFVSHIPVHAGAFDAARPGVRLGARAVPRAARSRHLLPLSMTTSVDAGREGAAFASFFEIMQGVYNSERTYHYLDTGRREKSATTFAVRWLDSAEKKELLSALENRGDDQKVATSERWPAQGMEISFYTKMESYDELVISATQALFVPTAFDASRGVLSGIYTRSEGYEEGGLTISDFAFDVVRNELLMTTEYAKVVSVDQITLVNPLLRLRRILNYAKDADTGHRTDTVLLAGFGVESKSTDGTQLVPMTK